MMRMLMLNRRPSKRRPTAFENSQEPAANPAIAVDFRKFVKFLGGAVNSLAMLSAADTIKLMRFAFPPGSLGA